MLIVRERALQSSSLPLRADEQDLHDSYKLVFITDRLYTHDKLTPIGVGGDKDESTNANKLIMHLSKRGRKLLRLARRVSGLLLHLTVFEVLELPPTSPGQEQVPASQDEEGSSQEHQVLQGNELPIKKHVAPALRIVSYDPLSKHKASCVVSPMAVLETVGGPYSAYLEADKRTELARVVAKHLSLCFSSSKGFDLILPWSGYDQQNNATNVNNITPARANEERVLRRKGRFFREGIFHPLSGASSS
jgi:hypothetical protein